MTAWTTTEEVSAEIEQLRARLLEIVLLALLACGAAGCAVAYAVGARGAALAFGLALPALLIAFWMSRRRRVALAGVLTVAVMQAAVTSISYNSFGIHDSVSILYALTILVASLLLTRAFYLVYMVLAVANAAWLVLTELTGWRSFEPPVVEVGMLITVPMMLLACGLIARVMTENLRYSLIRAQVKTNSLERPEAEQRRLVAELETKNAELEQLARTVYRELRSPLSSLRKRLGGLDESALAGDMERVRSDVQTINRSAAGMQKLLGELQAGARPRPRAAARDRETGEMTRDERVSAWFSARETPAEMEQLRARLLGTVLLTLTCSAGVGIVASYLVGYHRTALVMTLAAPALLIALWLSRRRRVALAGVLVVVVMQAVVTFLSYDGFGIHDSATVLYALNILIASLLLTRNLFLLYMVVAVGNVLWLIYVQLTGRVTFDQPWVDAGMLVTVPVILLACALIVRVMTENLRYGLVRARLKTRSLERAEAEQRRLVAELEEKNAELEHLAHIVSHDLKSPLLTIRGLLGFLEKDALAGNVERMRSDIERVNQAAAKMHELLGELHELSEVGSVSNPYEAVPFGELADEAVRLVSGRLEESGVEVDIAPDLPAVDVVRVRLVSVLQNLVENSVKFMGDQAEPRIEIGAENGGGTPVFFVRDNGIGIEEDEQSRVFRLFERLDSSVEGTGMGLALARRIIEAHGGRIWVESGGPGEGTAFCFTLGGRSGPAVEKGRRGAGP